MFFSVDGSVTYFWEDNGWSQIPGNKGLTSPIYTTARTLAFFQPEARLILLLREPVERQVNYFDTQATKALCKSYLLLYSENS